MILAHGVFAWGHDFHVIGVAATSVTAEVIQLHTVRYFLSLVVLVCDPVDYSLAVAWASLPFAVAVCCLGALPLPATVV